MVVDSKAATEQMAADVVAKLKGLGALAGVAMMSTGASMFMVSEATDHVDPQIGGGADDSDLAVVDMMAARKRKSSTTMSPQTSTSYLTSDRPRVELYGAGGSSSGSTSWLIFTDWTSTAMYQLMRVDDFEEVSDIANQISAADLNKSLAVMRLRNENGEYKDGFMTLNENGSRMTLCIEYVAELGGSTCNGVRGVAIKDDHHNTMAEIVETENKRTLRLSLEDAKKGFSGSFHTAPLRPEPVAGLGTKVGRVKFLTEHMRMNFSYGVYDFVTYDFETLMKDRNHVVHHVENPEELTWTFTCPRPGADTVVDAVIGTDKIVKKGMIRDAPQPVMCRLAG